MRVQLGDLVVEQNPTGAARFKLTDLEGWYGTTVRLQVDDMPEGDGGFNPVRSYRGVRRMVLRGFAMGSTPEGTVREVWQELSAIAPQGEQLALQVDDDGGTYYMDVWAGNVQVLPFAPRRARFSVELVATDPRKYGAPLELAPTGPAGSADDGLTFPMFAGGYLDFGAFTPSGLVYVANGGTAESWPIFHVRGTVDDGFQIISGTDVVEYSADLALGETVTLSPYAGGRAILAGADVTGGRLTQASWPSILPGETRLYVFNALGTADANARLTIEFREAWW